MLALYIGPYSEGSTSKLRADVLKGILEGWDFQVINSHIPFYTTNIPFRSIGFRTKKGPLVSAINEFIIQNIKNNFYDLIWVDKAVFITETTTKFLRGLTNHLVHFTPDPAFTFHKSAHFLRSIPHYDYLITTKSYELDCYWHAFNRDKVICVTQGFDPNFHKPYFNFDEKKFGVSFIGHYEKERSMVIQTIIDAGIPVILAGRNWSFFCWRNRNNKNLKFLGEGLYGSEYSKTLSQYYFSLGLISKWVKETHTTRTFEIPACETALITERNAETSDFFKEEEVIFFDDFHDIPQKILYYKNHPDALQILIKNGHKRVIEGGYDYGSILRKVTNFILATSLHLFLCYYILM